MNLIFRSSFITYILFSCLSILSSQSDFGAINIINKTEQNAPTSLFTVDINGDSHLDIVVTSTIDNRIAWYENLNGTGNFSDPIFIFDNSFDIELIELGDVDNDGHMDIVLPSADEDAIFWLRNRGNASSFSSPKVVNYLVLNPKESVMADLDGDGLEDITTITLGEGTGRMIWQKNLGGTFGQAQLIIDNLDRAEELYIADLEGDGDMDILLSEIGADRLSYYLNTDGNGNFASSVIIDQGIEDVLTMITQDVDGDGLTDILTASFTGGELYYYKSDGNLGYSKRFIAGGLAGSYDMITFDRDGDNDQDIFIAQGGENKIIVVDKLGSDTYAPPLILNDNIIFPYQLTSGDLSGNGLIDLASISLFDDKIAIYKNTGNAFQPEERLLETISGIKDVIKADLDQDGLQDLVTITTDISMVSWYRNLGTEQGYSAQQVITSEARIPLTFAVSDVDNDNLPDIVYGGFLDNHLSWVKNLGNGIFSIPREISQLDGIPTAISLGDMSDDGKVDIAVAMTDQDKVIWLEQTNVNTLWLNQYNLINNSGEVSDILHYDLDADGDNDLLMAQLDENRVIWQENINNNTNFSQARVILDNVSGPRTIEMGDLDSDGIDDLATAVTFDGDLVWQPRNGNTASFGASRVLDANTPGVLDLSIADFNNDNLLDIAYASSINRNIKIVYNSSTGFISPEVIKSEVEGISYVSASDIENDMDQDLVCVTRGVEELFWIENQLNNDCFANDFEISTSECIDDSFSIVMTSFTNTINPSLNFLITEDSPDQINIDANQISFGVFDVNTSPVWHVDLIDDMVNNCGKTYEIFSPLCKSSCSLSDLSLTVGSCNADGSTFSLNLDMDATMAANAGFDIIVDGQYFGYYLYDDLPLTIPNFPTNAVGSSNVRICDDDNPDCCISQELPTPCSCSFVNMEYEITACDTTTNEFFISFDFEPVMTSGQGIIVGGNGTTYGVFSEDPDSIPITIGPLAADGTFYFFSFFDQALTINCVAEIEVGVVNCADVVIVPDTCMIDNLVLSPTSCNPLGEYFLDISFEVSEEGANGYRIVDNDGNNYGTYDYSNTSQQIGPFVGDCMSLPGIIVTDIDNPNCTASTSLATPQCCDVDMCQIEGLNITLSDCEVNDTYTATIDFSVTDPGAMGFSISNNGQNLGTFNYTDLPLSIGDLASDCSTSPSFIISDIEDPTCEASFTFLEPKCCLPNCEYSNFSITTDCELDGTGTITLDILPGIDLGDNFDLSINGILINSYPYASLPITISAQIDLINSTLFTILDQDTGCSYEENVLLSCDNCLIEIGSINIESCQTDNTFSAVLEIASVGLDATGYSLNIDGTFISDFTLTNGSITIDDLDGDCSSLYSFTVTSKEDASCTSSFTLTEPVCCIDCELSNLSFEFDGCSGDQAADFTLDFDAIDVASDSFEVYIDEILLSNYAYADLPLSVDALDLGNMSSDFLIEVCDHNSECCISDNIVTPDCDIIVSCSIGGFSSDNLSCNFSTDEFTFDLNFIYTNVASDSFDLSGNLSDYGRFAYTDLPINIGPLDGDNITQYEYLVTDIADSECQASYQMGIVDCITDNIVDPLLDGVRIYMTQNNQLAIENVSSVIRRLNIYDYTGRKVYKEVTNLEYDTSIDLNHLNTGIYIIVLRRNAYTKTVKMMVQKS